MDKDEMKMVIVAWAIIIAIGALACTGLIFLDHTVNHNDSTAWDEFAAQINKDTDHYLDLKTGGSCGYIKTAGSEYSTGLNVSCYGSYGATVMDYVKVYAKEGGLALEWHKRTINSSDRVGDVITSTTYIPYESICYVQANKVV